MYGVHIFMIFFVLKKWHGVFAMFGGTDLEGLMFTVLCYYKPLKNPKTLITHAKCKRNHSALQWSKEFQ